MSMYEVQQLANYCKTHLDLTTLVIADEYNYPNLPLCIIDAIFSIGVKYESTKNTVNRFIKHSGDAVEYSVNDLLALFHEHSVEFMAKEVFQNLQRTSTKNGILKAEAVFRVAKVLSKHHVDSLIDMKKVVNEAEFEADFKEIPGQNSGISLRYFYMLAGFEDQIKPDRMVVRFLEVVLKHAVKVNDCHPLLIEACKLLVLEYPNINPRNLDHAIWLHQREQ